MSKTLIIPDIHLRHKIAEKIISHVKPDYIIFLGDYWDDFNDTIEMIRDTSDWFKWSVNQKNRIHLAGNHCVHYWFKDNIRVRCSGYEQYKSIAINDIVERKDWEKLKFFHVLDNKWLMSHGGCNPVWFDGEEFKPTKKMSKHSLSEVVGKLEHDSIQAKKELYANRENWFTYAGFSRSNCSRTYGGLLWCDYNHEFHPIRGINQIVGHTPQRSLKWIVAVPGQEDYKVLPIEDVNNPTLGDEISYNICIDSQPGSKYYAIYENGALTIHKTEDLK